MFFRTCRARRRSESSTSHLLMMIVHDQIDASNRMTNTALTNGSARMNSETTEMPLTSGPAVPAGLRDIDIGRGLGCRGCELLGLRIRTCRCGLGSRLTERRRGQRDSQHRRCGCTLPTHQQTSRARETGLIPAVCVNGERPYAKATRTWPNLGTGG